MLVVYEIVSAFAYCVGVPSKRLAGGPSVRGAFVLEDLNLGGTVIPCGSQLVAVNDKTTKDMEFEAARALAMTGTLGSVLRFE